MSSICSHSNYRLNAVSEVSEVLNLANFWHPASPISLPYIFRARDFSEARLDSALANSRHPTSLMLLPSRPRLTTVSSLRFASALASS